MHHSDGPTRGGSQRKRGNAADHADQHRIQATDIDPSRYSKRQTDRNRVSQSGDCPPGSFAGTSALSSSNRITWENDIGKIRSAQENGSVVPSTRTEGRVAH